MAERACHLTRSPLSSKLLQAAMIEFCIESPYKSVGAGYCIQGFSYLIVLLVSENIMIRVLLCEGISMNNSSFISLNCRRVLIFLLHILIRLAPTAFCAVVQTVMNDVPEVWEQTSTSYITPLLQRLLHSRSLAQRTSYGTPTPFLVSIGKVV